MGAGAIPAHADDHLYTIGFRHRHVTFVVRVDDADARQQMDAELDKPRSDRTMIVSGIVRGERSYNPEWGFSMGPRSVVLGEAFTEVCDARPEYVQQHRSSWMGERWCPWSSYVKKAGS
jgi:hypothetical protein